MEKKLQKDHNSVLEPASLTDFKYQDILLAGFIFLKYSKWNEPEERFFNLSSDSKSIQWIHDGETKASNSLPLSCIVGVKFGRHTPIFKKYPAISVEQEELSFSIIAEKRTLDLEASCKEHKDQFIEALISLMWWYKQHHQKHK